MLPYWQMYSCRASWLAKYSGFFDSAYYMRIIEHPHILSPRIWYSANRSSLNRDPNIYYFFWSFSVPFRHTIWKYMTFQALHKRSRIRKCNIGSYSLAVIYVWHTLVLPLLGNASELSQGVYQFITTNYLCDFSHTLIIPISTLTMLEKYSTQAAFNACMW